MSYAIKVVWLDGTEEYVRDGPTVRGLVARFPKKKDAEEMRNFMLIGMSDEVQSINVVDYPR